MKIAIQGCTHGELDKIYEAIRLAQERENIKVDLLVCCGDFQAVRNKADLECLACPPKYRTIGNFYEYYSGIKQAPVLTIYVGGNHEASNHHHELCHGGWVAPNIYYMGFAGVVKYGGIRIAGLSGIYKHHDYRKGHYEVPPYSESDIRSVYHVREFDAYRLSQLTGDVDIFLSHDWPTSVPNHGNLQQLLRKKAFLKDEIAQGILGSPACEKLLRGLCPAYWFSAHLHVKYPAVVRHPNGKSTKFLALDKCLPHRDFLQIIDVPDNTEGEKILEYDLEWLSIVKKTWNLHQATRGFITIPQDGPSPFSWKKIESSTEELLDISGAFANTEKGQCVIPSNFYMSVPSHQNASQLDFAQVYRVKNMQTLEFMQKLKLSTDFFRLPQPQNVNHEVQNTHFAVNDDENEDTRLSGDEKDDDDTCLNDHGVEREEDSSRLGAKAVHSVTNPEELEI